MSVIQNEFNTTHGLLTFENLPKGGYKLEEISTADGYQLLSKPIIFSVEYDSSGGGLTVKIIDSDSNNKKVEIEKGLVTYTVENQPGVELPETGGPGLIMMERFGWMLLLLAMLGAETQIFGSKRKREE